MLTLTDIRKIQDPDGLIDFLFMVKSSVESKFGTFPISCPQPCSSIIASELDGVYN